MEQKPSVKMEYVIRKWTLKMEIKNPRQIIIGFLIVAIIFFIYSDPIVAFINQQSPIMILILTTFLNPIYVLFIYGLYKHYGFRGLLTGALVSTASDIISLPHILLKNGQLSHSVFNLISENIFFKMLPEEMRNGLVNLPIVGEVSLGTFLIYVILSTSIVVIAFMISHKKRFIQLFKESV